MKLQIALDCTSAERAIEVMDQVKDVVDIIELGQVGVVQGAIFIKEMQKRYPDLEIILDLKVNHIYSYLPAIEYGVDYISVADMPEERLEETVEQAHKGGVKVVGDVGYSCCDAKSMYDYAKYGCDQLSFFPFISHENSSLLPLKLANLVKEETNIEISVYGALTVNNLIPVLELTPDIVVVGAAIWNAENPRQAALEIRDLMNRYE